MLKSLSPHRLRSIHIPLKYNLHCFRKHSSMSSATQTNADDGLNDDKSKLVFMRTSEQDWISTRSAGDVWRRRVFRLGGQESGRVTSVVRYDASAKFHHHPHPQGEEIFVLDGVFSDWRGDHPTNTFLLNPEGFEHEPYSTPGCLLFVRLRQYANSESAERTQHAIKVNDEAAAVTGNNNDGGSGGEPMWRSVGSDVERFTLYRRKTDFADEQYLLRAKKGASIAIDAASEVFVVRGDLSGGDGDGGDAPRELRAHDWLRLPPQSTSLAYKVSSESALLLVKTNTIDCAFAALPEAKS